MGAFLDRYAWRVLFGSRIGPIVSIGSIPNGLPRTSQRRKKLSPDNFFVSETIFGSNRDKKLVSETTFLSQRQFLGNRDEKTCLRDNFFVSETSFLSRFFCLGFYVDCKERQKSCLAFFVSVFMLTSFPHAQMEGPCTGPVMPLPLTMGPCTGP